MPKFAVYYVPPADSNLYQRGSDILGYDVRAGRFPSANNATRQALPEFDESWVQRPQSYGFHVTVGYSLFFEMSRLPEIEHEMANVCGCFGRDVSFALTPDPDEPIPFWEDNIVVLRFHPNPAMLMLHTMLTARVNPYGTTSTIAEYYARETAKNLDPVNLLRVRQYHTPYILDGWVPHMTLMQPYAGQNPQATRTALADLFPPSPLAVENICLLLKEDGETHYRLYREFMLSNGATDGQINQKWHNRLHGETRVQTE
jgi:hypothetical protein